MISTIWCVFLIVLYRKCGVPIVAPGVRGSRAKLDTDACYNWRISGARAFGFQIEFKHSVIDVFAGWSRISARCYVFNSLNATFECGRIFSLSKVKQSRRDEDENLWSYSYGGEGLT